ncbi:CpXC domain-containing protein [Candidatus Chloroploca sp. Khr17]|uniref:CpXC domain-containing protein n=1 Tax=Candidatus Chloroploca sp. Khr17 TaxID=2496869 RepID=UPI00101CBBD4|nr:CpXC domain-containing protein [Candidatus Chloroploca sp. Khr17]
MPIAYQEPEAFVCPDCGADFEAPVWLILDAQEVPEAVAALLEGTLNLVTCPACQRRGPAGAPLLFHDGLARRVIFAPAPGLPEHAWGEQARDLHAVLVGSIPEEARRPYLADVDIAQDLAGIAHLLRRIKRRPVAQAESGVPEAPVGPPVHEPVAAAQVRPPADEQDAPPLLLAVEALLGANSAEELEQVVAQYPILFAPTTDAVLNELVEVAANQRAFEIAESLREARALLARMSQRLSVALPPALVAGEPVLPAALTYVPDEVLQALLQAQSAAEVAQVAAQHPLLLQPEIDQLLAERIEQALDDEHERLAQVLEDRREALAQVRAQAAGDPGELDEAIEALLLADGVDSLSQVLDRYPILLEEVALQALWQFAAEARAVDDHDLARYAIECREMLLRVRKGLNSS